MYCAPAPLALPPRASVDWAAAFAAWFGGRPATTNAARRQDLRKLAAYLGAPDELEAIRRLTAAGEGQARAVIHAWTAEQRENEDAPASIARRLGTLGSLFAELRLHGLPWDLVIRRPKIGRYTARGCPAWASIVALGAKLGRRRRARPQLAALWLLADVGLRRAEICGLDTPRDVLRDGTAVRVVRKGGAIEERTISTRCSAALLEVCGTRVGPVLEGQRGRLTPSGLARWCRTWGIGSPHSFRTAAASRLRELGAHPRQIQAWLGHANLATTQFYLTQLEDEAGAATRMLEHDQDLALLLER